jgi:glutamate--cysteine ligase
LEKESLRITGDGYIAKTPHPFSLEKNVSRDFCENQVEIVTDVYPTVESLYLGLQSTDRYVKDTLKALPETEYLWSFSNPPYFKGEKDIPVATFQGELKEKQTYREYLANKYGKRLMLYSGIHYNFSFDQEFLQQMCSAKKQKNYENFVNNTYLDLAKKLLKYSWLIVSLTSASPLYDCSLVNENFLGVDGFNGYASMRNSPDGYWNQFNLILDYSSLGAYVDSIQHYVTTGEIASVGECYIPIRLKPRGDNSLEKLKDGIDHIELRMFDLNPLDSVGIKVEDLKFVHYLMLYLLSLPSIELSPTEQVNAMENHKKASAFSLESVEIFLDNKRVPLITEALSIVDGMLKYFKVSNVGVDFDVIEFQRQKLLRPEKRYSNQVYETFRGGFVTNGLKINNN